MFNICVLERKETSIVERCWLDNYLIPISNYQSSKNEQKVIAFFHEQNLSNEQAFFTFSHPNYFQISSSKVYIAHKVLKQAYTEFLDTDLEQIFPPENNFFSCIRIDNSISKDSFRIDEFPDIAKLVPYHLLIFNTLKDFNIFSAQIDSQCVDPNVKGLFENIKKLRTSNYVLQKEYNWHKKQSEVLKTSLSLIRTEFQSDLQWYKNELEKVIKWYRENHEELPPGIIRLGKGINSVKKRLRFRK